MILSEFIELIKAGDIAKIGAIGEDAVLELLRSLENSDLQDLLAAQDEHGAMVLHYVAGLGYLDVVEYLVEGCGADINAKDEHDTTVFRVGSGHFTIVDYLLGRGVEVNDADRELYFGLHHAAGKGYLNIVKYLLEKGTEIDSQDDNGNTALHRAAGEGYLDVVEYLVDRGTDIDARDTKGNTALHHAAGKGYLGVVEYLLERGANIDSQDANDRTALQHAARKGYLAIVDYLLERGAEMDANGAMVYYAAEEGHLNIVKYLLEKGTDIDSRDDANGRTALHRAAGKGHLNIVEYLVDRKADINAQDDNGCTALHRAAGEGYLNIVEYLVAHGADVNAKNKSSETALQHAARAGHSSVIGVLKARQQPQTDVVVESTKEANVPSNLGLKDSGQNNVHMYVGAFVGAASGGITLLYGFTLALGVGAATPYVAASLILCTAAAVGAGAGSFVGHVLESQRLGHNTSPGNY